MSLPSDIPNVVLSSAAHALIFLMSSQKRAGSPGEGQGLYKERESPKPMGDMPGGRAQEAEREMWRREG